MKKYLCVKLLEVKNYTIIAKSYGLVDIRVADNDLPNEEKIFNESKRISNSNIDINKAYRMATIVRTQSIEQAIEEATFIFEEVLDLFFVPFSSIKCTLSEVGYICEAEDFTLTPLMNIDISDYQTQLTAFQVYQGVYPPLTSDQYILAGRDDEATSAVIRASHWIRKIESENNKVIQFLYYWIAIETISKINESDNIINKMCLCAGFPLSSHSRLINRDLLKQLKTVEKYNFWRETLKKKFEEMRKFRNNIVHNGFRYNDYPLNQIDKFINILSITYIRIKEYYIKALLDEIVSIEGIWEIMHIKFQEFENLQFDIEKRVIPFLEKNKCF